MAVSRSGNKMAIRAKLQGFEEFDRRLAFLEKAVRNRITRRAILAGSKPVLAAAKAGAKEVKESGLYAKSLGRKVKTYTSGTTVAIVGPRFGFGGMVTLKRGFSKGSQRYRDPTFVAHLIEKGTRAHHLGKGSRLRRMDRKRTREAFQRGRRHPGAMARRVLQKAWNVSNHQAQAIIRREILAGITEAARKKGGGR